MTDLLTKNTVHERGGKRKKKPSSVFFISSPYLKKNNRNNLNVQGIVTMKNLFFFCAHLNILLSFICLESVELFSLYYFLTGFVLSSFVFCFILTAAVSTEISPHSTPQSPKPSRLSDHPDPFTVTLRMGRTAVIRCDLPHMCPFWELAPPPRARTATRLSNPWSVRLCFFQIRTCFHYFHPSAEPSSHSSRERWVGLAADSWGRGGGVR